MKHSILILILGCAAVAAQGVEVGTLPAGDRCVNVKAVRYSFRLGIR